MLLWRISLELHPIKLDRIQQWLWFLARGILIQLYRAVDISSEIARLDWKDIEVEVFEETSETSLY